ncbi:MAG TPA: ParB/RepB/Spo0J family partition protein [Tepidisphaeraceae bacterium]|nr:ParB/RepB/Spo0J family partition protein [Tepidisphaeraceae bacterium]
MPIEAETGDPNQPIIAPPFSTHPVADRQGFEAPLTRTPSEIPVATIAPNPHQPRKQFDEAAIASLATSIKTTGLVQPIIVRALPTTDGEPQYELIAGERRLRAAKAAGLATLPAIVREVDAFTQAQMALIENIQREDLNPIDRAQAYRALMDQLGLTQAELAGRLGEERSSIANYLRLLDLAETVREHLRSGALSLGHAKILAGVADPVAQAALAEKTVTQGLSVRNLERLLQTPDAPTPAKQGVGDASAHIRDLEKNITSTLGMKVQLRQAAKKGQGKLVIHYSTLDQFDSLLDKLGVKAE